jgi:hypothetical protein
MSVDHGVERGGIGAMTWLRWYHRAHVVCAICSPLPEAPVFILPLSRTHLQIVI